MVGLHGMYGAEYGRLAHSFWPGIRGLWVNGTKWGEIAANAWEARQHGVPVVHLAGDLAACREVDALIPGVTTTCVKEGMTPHSLHTGQAPTLTMSPAKAREDIQAGVSAGLKGPERPSSFHVEPPYEIRTQFESEKLTDWMMEHHEGLTRIDETTVGYGGDAFRLVL